MEKLTHYCENHKFNLSNPLQLDNGDMPQAKRKQIMTSNQNSLTRNIVYVRGLGLNWCMVPKVASTSLSTIFAPYLQKLNKKHKYKSIHSKVWARAGHLKYSDYVRKLFDKVPSFLVARHPFTRIVSAYKNKFENKTLSHGLFKKWSKHITE